MKDNEGEDLNNDNPFVGDRLGALGSLGDDRQEGSLMGGGGTALQDMGMDGECPTTGAPMPGFSGILEPPQQPVNMATMECHRGPCIHLWRLVSRLEALYDASSGIRIQAIRQCNAHYEPTNLVDENVYQCSLWWPGFLSFIPQSLRFPLRPRLRKLWEAILRRQGYDFSWRTWADDVFEKDDTEGRKKGGLKQSKPGLSFKDEFDALLREEHTRKTTVDQRKGMR